MCALASALDDAVGEVIHTLKEKGLYEVARQGFFKGFIWGLLRGFRVDGLRGF